MLSCLWLIESHGSVRWLLALVREEFGVKDLRQYLQAFDDARPRTVEILIAIRDKDALSSVRAETKGGRYG